MNDCVDNARVSALIGRIYEAALDPSGWSRFLSDLMEVLHSPHAMMCEVHAAPTRPPVAITVGLDLEIIEQWRGCCEHVDVWYQALALKNVRPAYYGHELVPTRQLLGTGFYADILKPHDIVHCVGGAIEQTRHDKWIFAVYRGDANGEYSDEDRRLLRELVPHFKRAMAIAERLNSLAITKNRLVHALDHVPCAVLVLDSDCRPRDMNRKAHEIFSRDDGLTLSNGRLRAWLHEDQKSLEAAVERSLRRPDTLASCHPNWLTINRPSGEPPLQVLVAPMARRRPLFPDDRGERPALILIRSPDDAATISPLMLMSLYGLTMAEARICVELFEGGTLGDVATRLQLSRNTAKTHLRNVFQKMHVSSQTELIREIGAWAGYAPETVAPDVI